MTKSVHPAFRDIYQRLEGLRQRFAKAFENEHGLARISMKAHATEIVEEDLQYRIDVFMATEDGYEDTAVSTAVDTYDNLHKWLEGAEAYSKMLKCMLGRAFPASTNYYSSAQ